MHENTALIEAPIDRYFGERILPSVYQARMPLMIYAWEVRGEPVPFAVAKASRFEPFAPGTAWGRPWGTTWFRLRGRVPADWPAPASGSKCSGCGSSGVTSPLVFLSAA